MLAAAHGDLSQAGGVGLLERLPHHGERFGLRVLIRNNKIRLLKERRIELLKVDELLHLQRVLRRNAEVLDLLRVDLGVLAFAVLIALHDVGFFDRLFIRLRDLLVTDTCPGFTVDLVKVNFAFGFGGGKELDAERNQRNLDLS